MYIVHGGFCEMDFIIFAGSKKCVGPKKRRAWAVPVGRQDRFFLIFSFFFIKEKDKNKKGHDCKKRQMKIKHFA